MPMATKIYYRKKELLLYFCNTEISQWQHHVLASKQNQTGKQPCPWIISLNAHFT
jgi:hypothetical protein